ncbi:dysbindin protein homolog [Drosophila subobscura]|uniref:dysbindin protein homolog n=1 Tax=Drosophila subobscura TaxID=7241 RepID=UPI00155B0A3E|nr:dysbindin protein homolog [Drosophila subobscura]
MFGSLKKKLSSAIQEGIVISESLQQQYRQRVSSGQSSAATTPTSPLGLNESLASSRSSSLSLGAPFHLADALPSHLNVAAGCSLLAMYEDDWQQIHETNEENAERATAVATQITAVQQRAERQRRTISDLSGSLAGIPTLIPKLQASIETLRALEDMGNRLETELEKLEDLCEECEMQEFMLDKQFDLSRHKQQKLNELEKYRQHIASQHQAKIQDHEQQLRKLQRERQAVFDDAFRCDMDEYKQYGQLTKIQATQATSNKLALEEVVLEANDVETKDALEQFLNG